MQTLEGATELVTEAAKLHEEYVEATANIPSLSAAVLHDNYLPLVPTMNKQSD